MTLPLGILLALCLFGWACALETPLAGYSISWTVESAKLTLTLEVETKGWIGFGISSGSGMRGADIVRIDGDGGIEDGYSLERGAPNTDCVQDWEILCREVEDGVTKVIIRRALDTGDTQDHAIVDDGFDTMIILAHGSAGQSHFSYHAERRAPMSVNFFGKTASNTSISGLKADPDIVKVDFLMHSGEPGTPFVLPVPGNVDPVTTYIDVCMDLPADLVESGGYIVGFEASIQPGNEDVVHHFAIYGLGKSCAELGGLVGRWDYEGFKMLWVWAVGTGDYALPSNVGLPVGGANKVVALVSNIHYDNPQLEEGRKDSSGVTVHYTKLPRRYFMGTLQLGDPRVSLGGKPVLAEGSPSTKVRHNFNCPKAFFSEARWSGDVAIVGSLLHMHGAGVHMRTEVVDWMGRQKHAWKRDYYDGGWQIIAGLSNVRLESGDSVKVACVFDDAKKATTAETLSFGFESANEMCIDFVFYYTDNMEVLSAMNDGGGQCGIGVQDEGIYHSSSPVDNIAEEMGIAFGRPPRGKDEETCESVETPPELTYDTYAVGDSTINVGLLGGGGADDAATATATIVALHGFPQASVMWFRGFAQELIRQLTPLRARVVAPDMRGVNRTMPKYPCDDMGCGAYTPTAITDEIASLLILHFNAEAKPVHLIGHDWGAAIAWRLAILYPGLVQTLSAADITHPAVFRQFLLHDERQMAASAYAGYLANAEQTYNETKPTASKPDSDLVLSVIAVAPDMEYKYKDAWLYEESLKSHLFWYRGSAAFDNIAEGINESNMVLDLPVLQLWGAEDAAVLPSQICCLKSVAKRLHVKVFEGVGHWLIDERPREAAKIIASHISGGLETDPCSAVEAQCAQDRQQVCDAEQALPPHSCDASKYPDTLYSPVCEVCRDGGPFNPGVSLEDNGEVVTCQDTRDLCWADMEACGGECRPIQDYLVNRGCCGALASTCDFCAGATINAEHSYWDEGSSQYVKCGDAVAYCKNNMEACGNCGDVSAYLSASGCCGDSEVAGGDPETCDVCSGSAAMANHSFEDPSTGTETNCGDLVLHCTTSPDSCGGCSSIQLFAPSVGCCSAQASDGTCDFCAGSTVNAEHSYWDEGSGQYVKCDDVMAYCKDNAEACGGCEGISAHLAVKGCCTSGSGDRRLSAKGADIQQFVSSMPRLLQSAPQTCKAYLARPASTLAPEQPMPRPTPAPSIEVEKIVALDEIPEDADTFLDDLLSTIASEQGVELDAVSVQSLRILITVGYAFPDAVEEEDVRTAIAGAVELPIDQVVLMPSGGSSGSRRLATAQHVAQLATNDFSVAAAVIESATNVTKLAEALQEIDPGAEAPSVTQAPKLEVKVSTSVLGGAEQDRTASAARLSSHSGVAWIIIAATLAVAAPRCFHAAA